MKKTISIITLACLLTVALSGAALAFGDKSYFAGKNVSVDQLTAVWGQPLKTVQSDDGSQVLIFDRHSNGFPYENRYFVIQNGIVVDGGLNY